MPFGVDEGVRVEGVDVADAHDQQQDVAGGARGVDIGPERPVALARLEHVGDVLSRALVEVLQGAGDLGMLCGGVGELDDEASRELALGLGVGDDDVGDPLRCRRRADVASWSR